MTDPDFEAAYARACVVLANLKEIQTILSKSEEE